MQLPVLLARNRHCYQFVEKKRKEKTKIINPMGSNISSRVHPIASARWGKRQAESKGRDSDLDREPVCITIMAPPRRCGIPMVKGKQKPSPVRTSAGVVGVCPSTCIFLAILEPCKGYGLRLLIFSRAHGRHSGPISSQPAFVLFFHSFIQSLYTRLDARDGASAPCHHTLVLHPASSFGRWHTHTCTSKVDLMQVQCMEYSID